MLRAILYYDIFRHPLTLGEVQRLCGFDPANAVRDLTAAGRMEVNERWLCRPGGRGQIEGRRIRAKAAERHWPVAMASSAFLARFPWVRGVLVTGSMSKQSADPAHVEIDFLVLVEPGRVWTAKSALQGLRRVMPEAGRDLLCTNYLLSVDSLALPEQNAFTAMELATAVPVYGAGPCTALLVANAWARRWVPGWDWSLERAGRAAALPVARVARAMEAAIGDRFEVASRRAWTTWWDRKYHWLPESVRSQRFKRRPEVATNHLHDFQQYVLDEYHRRLAEEGVPAP